MSFASPKQRDLIVKLYNQLMEDAKDLNESDASVIARMIEPHITTLTNTVSGDDVTKFAASKLIEVLLAAAKLTTPHDICSWRKVGGSWFIAGPKDVVVPGATVKVRSRNGDKDVEIASVDSVDGNIAYGVVKKEDIRADLQPGLWRNNAGDIIEISYTRNNQLVGKKVNENGKRTYLGKAGLVGITDPLSLEEAKEFGKKTGVCVCCGRELTDPESITLGIGPICLSKNYGA